MKKYLAACKLIDSAHRLPTSLERDASQAAKIHGSIGLQLKILEHASEVNRSSSHPAKALAATSTPYRHHHAIINFTNSQLTSTDIPYGPKL